MEVVLHYRPFQSTEEELQKITAGALQEFRTRRLASFVPWFPSHIQSAALKPERCPPFILEEEILNADHHSTALKSQVSSQSYDSTFGLLEFQPNVINTKTLVQVQTGKLEQNRIACEKRREHKKTPVNEKMVLRRSWSICTQGGDSRNKIIPLSEELKSNLNRLKLQSFHRGKWTIVPSVCGGHSLEEVWEQLNRVIRRHLLPTCNATMRRDINEIWVFCDLLFCEFTGTLLKTELKLTGQIDLFVHKHGMILSM